MSDNFAMPDAPASTMPSAVPAAAVATKTEQPAPASVQDLRREAEQEVGKWELVAERDRGAALNEKWREADRWVQAAAAELQEDLPGTHPLHQEAQWVVENMRPLRAALRETGGL